MLEKFSIYLSYKLKSFSLVEKLHEYELKKILNVLIFGLVLRNTSVSSYRILLEDFPFLSLLLLEKINSGATDAVKCVQNAGKTSENVCFWKYFAGDTMFQTCQFSKKITSVLHCCQRTTESSAFTLQGIFHRKSRINWVVLTWTFGWWFNHQLHSRLLVYANFKKRTYCTQLCNLRFFF